MEKYHTGNLKTMKRNVMGCLVSICGLAKKEQWGGKFSWEWGKINANLISMSYSRDYSNYFRT